VSLAVPFVLVPILEIILFVVVGQRIGIWPLVLVIVVTGVLGAVIARRQGAGVLLAARKRLAGGEFPGPELAHGAMVLVGGVLLITPGFVTDVIGFLLMVPAVRESLRRWGKRRLRGRFRVIEIEPDQ